jgi:DNA-binding transcriptional ArsR family regulator
MNDIFKALNDPNRRLILGLLHEKDMTAGEIASKFTISWAAVSHHLELLRHSRLVTSEKQGQYVYYSLNTAALDEAAKWLVQLKSKKSR